MSEAIENRVTGDTGHDPVEADRPNNGLLAVFVAATLLAIVLTVLFINEVFKVTMEREISRKVLEPPHSALRSLRAMEQERLTRYQWVNEKDGIVRIPVEQAIPLTLKDYQEKRIGRPVVPAAAAATPEQGAEPADGSAKPNEASTPNAAGGDAAKADDAAKPGDKGAQQPEGAQKPAGAAASPEGNQPATTDGATQEPAAPATETPVQ